MVSLMKIFGDKRLIDIIAERQTLILDKPLIYRIIKRERFQENIDELEEEIIAKYWGEKLASGIISRIVSEVEKEGVKVPEDVQKAMIKAWGRVVARGMIR